MVGDSSQQWFTPAENPICFSSIKIQFWNQRNLLWVLIKTLKIYQIGTSAVTECMNPKPCAYSNASETARGETHCKLLLLSYKKF